MGDETAPKPHALGIVCCLLMAGGIGMATALNASDLGWWVFGGVAMALAFAANVKRVLHPALRGLAVLAQILCAGAMIVSFLFVMSVAEAGAGPPWWAVPLALCLIGVCAMAALTGVRAFRRDRAP